MPRLELSRSQILCFRRRVGSLDERSAGAKSLRRAAWAGVAGLHAARRLIVDPCASRGYGLNHLGAPFADPALGPAVQRLRRGREGPRCILARAVAGSRPPPRKGARYCCAAPRVPRWPANAVRPSRRAMSVQPNSLRYAALTGTVLLRWDGAHQPVVWTAAAPNMDARNARLELVRRYSTFWVRRRPRRSRAGPGCGRQRCAPRSRRSPMS